MTVSLFRKWYVSNALKFSSFSNLLRHSNESVLVLRCLMADLTVCQHNW